MCLARVRQTGVCVYVSTSKTARRTKETLFTERQRTSVCQYLIAQCFENYYMCEGALTQETSFYGFFFSVLKGMNYDIVYFQYE